MAAMGRSVIDAGGAIVEILATDQLNPMAHVEKADLRSWIEAPRLTVTTVRDPDANPAQSITALQAREFTYVVDLATMRILIFYIGSTAGPGDSAALRAMRDVLALLGPKKG